MYQQLATPKRWLNTFLEDFLKYKDHTSFPEKALADQAISMVEDMARQIAVQAAEM